MGTLRADHSQLDCVSGRQTLRLLYPCQTPSEGEQWREQQNRSKQEKTGGRCTLECTYVWYGIVQTAICIRCCFHAWTSVVLSLTSSGSGWGEVMWSTLLSLGPIPNWPYRLDPQTHICPVPEHYRDTHTIQPINATNLQPLHNNILHLSIMTEYTVIARSTVLQFKYVAALLFKVKPWMDDGIMCRAKKRTTCLLLHSQQ